MRHRLHGSPSGRFSAYYMSEAENVTIFDSEAKMWKFVLEEDATVEQLSELVGTNPDTISCADVLWMIDTVMSIDTWLEVCPHDLERYGQTGVSY